MENGYFQMWRKIETAEFFTTDAWVIVDGTHNKIEEIVACEKTLLRRQIARQFILSMMELNVLI